MLLKGWKLVLFLNMFSHNLGKEHAIQDLSLAQIFSEKV